MKHSFLILILTLLFSCTNKSHRCKQMNEEKYSDIKIEPEFLEEQHKYIEYLYSKFDAKKIDNSLIEGYQIIFYSSHGYGKLINFEESRDKYILKMKSIQKKDFTNYKDNYSIQIDSEDWNKFIDMIYEYDFWTEETQEKKKESVLDGSVIYITGYRSAAKLCKKRYSHFILKSSPEYDKIGSLVRDIIDYEERLHFKYRQNSRY